MSVPVLAFALGVVAVVALALGLTTAFRSTKGGWTSQLSDRSRAGATSNRLRGGLVVSQVALTLVLLVGAGLLARSLFRLLDVDPGFRRTGVLVIDLSHPYPDNDAESAALRSLQERLLARLRALPGVQSAGIVARCRSRPAVATARS